MTPSPPPPALFENAWVLANEAGQLGEVPVGAIVCEYSSDNGRYAIIGRGKNEILAQKDPSAHAELLSIREACANQNSERLSNSILISTLEPCLLCSGALLLARIETVYYFARVQTGLGLVRLLEEHSSEFNHRPELIQVPEYSERSSNLLIDFFKNRR